MKSCRMGHVQVLIIIKLIVNLRNIQASVLNYKNFTNVPYCPDATKLNVDLKEVFLFKFDIFRRIHRTDIFQIFHDKSIWQIFSTDSFLDNEFKNDDRVEYIICSNYKFFVISDQIFYVQSVYHRSYYSSIGKITIAGYLEQKSNNIYKLYIQVYGVKSCKELIEIKEKYKINDILSIHG